VPAHGCRRLALLGGCGCLPGPARSGGGGGGAVVGDSRPERGLCPEGGEVPVHDRRRLARLRRVRGGGPKNKIWSRKLLSQSNYLPQIDVWTLEANSLATLHPGHGRRATLLPARPTLL
jgi:hypothetical protein